jgi:hypothetical protein
MGELGGSWENEREDFGNLDEGRSLRVECRNELTRRDMYSGPSIDASDCAPRFDTTLCHFLAISCTVCLK